MIKFVELVGTLAPALVVIILFSYRRRAPAPVGWGMAGAVVAGAGSLTELISSRAVWFGGGAEGVFERLEGWGMLRFILVGSGLVLLAVAALIGEGRKTPRIPLAIGGTVVAAAGCGLRMVHLHLDDPDHTALATMALEILQFALLGFSTLLLGLAVVSGRGDGPEPLGQAAKLARRIAVSIREDRLAASRERFRSNPTRGSVWDLARDLIGDRDSSAPRSTEPHGREDEDADGR